MPQTGIIRLNENYRTVYRYITLFAALGSILILTEFPPGTPERRHSKYARTRRLAVRLITLEITPCNEPPVEVVQLNGGITKAGLEGKTIYGFSPVMSDPVNRTVTIKVYQLSRTKRLGQVVGESLKEMRTLVVDKESDRYFTTSGEQGIDLARDEL